jgi:hypothetical protein
MHWPYCRPRASAFEPRPLRLHLRSERQEQDYQALRVDTTGYAVAMNTGVKATEFLDCAPLGIMLVDHAREWEVRDNLLEWFASGWRQQETCSSWQVNWTNARTDLHFLAGWILRRLGS